MCVGFVVVGFDFVEVDHVAFCVVRCYVSVWYDNRMCLGSLCDFPFSFVSLLEPCSLGVFFVEDSDDESVNSGGESLECFLFGKVSPAR